MRLLARVLSRVSGQRLSDVTSGFRAVNRRGIRVFAAHYPCEYLGDTVESLVIAVRTGVGSRQVPVAMHVRCGWTGQPGHAPVRSLPVTRRGCSRPGAGTAVADGLAAPVDPLTGGQPGLLGGLELPGEGQPGPGGLGSVFTLGLLFEMLRRQRLREKYAVFWAGVAVLTLLVAAFPGRWTGRPR